MQHKTTNYVVGFSLLFCSISLSAMNNIGKNYKGILTKTKKAKPPKDYRGCSESRCKIIYKN